jgi:hypothetical protein
MKFPNPSTHLMPRPFWASKKERFDHTASRVMLEMPLNVPVRINTTSPYLGDIVLTYTRKSPNCLLRSRTCADGSVSVVECVFKNSPDFNPSRSITIESEFKRIGLYGMLRLLKFARKNLLDAHSRKPTPAQATELTFAPRPSLIQMIENRVSSLEDVLPCGNSSYYELVQTCSKDELASLLLDTLATVRQCIADIRDVMANK